MLRYRTLGRPLAPELNQLMGLRTSAIKESVKRNLTVKQQILVSGASVSSVDLITLGLLALQVGFVLMMIVYLISGLDDLFVDLLFFAMKAKQWSGGTGPSMPSSLTGQHTATRTFALPAIIANAHPATSRV